MTWKTMLIELWGGPCDGFVIDTQPMCDHTYDGHGHVHCTTVHGTVAATGGLAPVSALFEDAGTAHVHTLSCGVWRYRLTGHESVLYETVGAPPVTMTRFEFVRLEAL
jgi:hypothetical protein